MRSDIHGLKRSAVAATATLISNRVRTAKGFAFKARSVGVCVGAPLLACAALLGAAVSTAPATAGTATMGRTLVGLGPVRFYQSQIIDGRSSTDASGATTVVLYLKPLAGQHVANALRNYEGRNLVIRVNGQKIATANVVTAADGQLVTLGGIITQEKAATIALKLSGKPPAPTIDEE